MHVGRKEKEKADIFSCCNIFPLVLSSSTLLHLFTFSLAFTLSLVLSFYLSFLFPPPPSLYLSLHFLPHSCL